MTRLATFAPIYCVITDILLTLPKGYESACNALANSQYRVLVSDIGLPDGNGFDLITEPKRRQALIGVVLMAYTSRRDLKRGMDAGFDHYLSKSLDVCQLRTILNGLANW
jgi:DNA-binding response OmpR family regulator